MADPKTKGLGSIPVSKLSKLSEWTAYMTAARNFSEAKDKVAEAKKAMKAALKKGSTELRDVDNLDFTWTQGDKEITVFEQLQTSSRRGGKEIAFG
jgi:hypothetical protein